MWFRNSQPPPPSNGFPPDAVVVVIPKVVLDRLFAISAIVILLAFGSTITLTLHPASNPTPSSQKSGS
jgi:hypothetical protein